MKKKLLIALGCLAIMFAACHKPDDPTPDPTADYTANYVGNYVGDYNFTITSMNHQTQTGMSFPIEDIRMDITKGTEDNAITATVTVDNETRQTNGIATADKAEFETVHFIIDKPDQGYKFELDLSMEGTKADSDTLNITGTFAGNGYFIFQGEENTLDEVSGNLSGTLAKQ